MIIQKVQNKNPSDMKPFLDIVCSTFVIGLWNIAAPYN